MKKIIFVLPDIRGGGAERIVINLLKILDRNEFSPELFLFFNEGVYWSEIPGDVPIHYACSERRRLRYCFYAIFSKLSDLAKNADIIVGGRELLSTYFAVLVGRQCKCVTIGWVHTEIDSYLDRMERGKQIHSYLIKYLYPKLDGVITVSAGSRESLLKYFPEDDAHKIKTIFNPNSLNEIKEKAKNMEFILNHDIPIVMGIGRLEPEKNFGVLIRAHKKLIGRGTNHNLYILGEGALRTSLERLISELEVQSTVTLLGFQENPYAYLAQADVFALTSLFEGLPTVIIEALSLGIPVVSTDCPSGPREILKDGQFGLLVKNDDVDAIAGGMEKMLADRSLRESFSVKGKYRANIFDQDSIKGQFKEYFLRLCK